MTKKEHADNVKRYEIIAVVVVFFLLPFALPASAQEVGIQQGPNNPITRSVGDTTVGGMRAGNKFMEAPDYSATSSVQILKEINNMFTVKSLKIKDLVSAVQNKAMKAIDGRVVALTTLSQRISGVQLVSDTEKIALHQEMAEQISSLQDLKSKISTEVSTQSLKSDVEKLTSTMRMYSLTIPKSALLVTIDRISVIAVDMQAMGLKLKSIIDSVSVSGVDVSQAQSTLLDYNASVTNAQSIISTAQNSLEVLPYDVRQSASDANVYVLKEVQRKVVQATKDLVSARQNITIIRNAMSQLQQPSTVQQATTTQTL